MDNNETGNMRHWCTDGFSLFLLLMHPTETEMRADCTLIRALPYSKLEIILKNY